MVTTTLTRRELGRVVELLQIVDRRGVCLRRYCVTGCCCCCRTSSRRCCARCCRRLGHVRSHHFQRLRNVRPSLPSTKDKKAALARVNLLHNALGRLARGDKLGKGRVAGPAKGAEQDVVLMGHHQRIRRRSMTRRGRRRRRERSSCGSYGVEGHERERVKESDRGRERVL